MRWIGWRRRLEVRWPRTAAMRGGDLGGHGRRANKRRGKRESGEGQVGVGEQVGDLVRVLDHREGGPRSGARRHGTSVHVATVRGERRD